MDLFTKWNFKILEEIVHEDYELSDQSVSILKTDIPKGRDNFLLRLKAMKRGMPNMAYTIIAIVAEEDKAISHWTVRGTQEDLLFGFPSLGKSAEVFGTIYFNIKDGKIIRAYVNFDTYSFLFQLGHIQLGPETSTDVLSYLNNVEKIAAASYEYIRAHNQELSE